MWSDFDICNWGGGGGGGARYTGLSFELNVDLSMGPDEPVVNIIL